MKTNIVEITENKIDLVEVITRFFSEANYQIDNIVLCEEKDKKSCLIEFKKDCDEFVDADDVLASINKHYAWSENESIGVNLRNIRENAGYTQTALAKLAGINCRHISEMERGKRTIGKKLAKKFASILNTDYRMFL